MPTVLFVSPEGVESIVDAHDGESVMKAGFNAAIEGIAGDCGGNLACATCHGYVDAAWRAKLAAPSEEELTMLGYAVHVTEDSRLTCQITMKPELDGIVVRVPEPF